MAGRLAGIGRSLALTLIKEAVDALDNVIALIFIVFISLVKFAVLSGGLFIGDTE